MTAAVVSLGLERGAAIGVKLALPDNFVMSRHRQRVLHVFVPSAWH